MQVVLTLGIVLAQAINLGTQHIPNYGWRISLAFAGVPAIVLTLGGLLLPDTPNSLIERGHHDQGKQVRCWLLTTHYRVIPLFSNLQRCREA